MLLHRRQTRDAHHQRAAQQVGDHGGAALVWDVGQLHIGPGFQDFHAQVRGRAIAVRAIGKFSRFFLEQGDQLGQGVGGHLWVDHNRVRVDGGLRQGLEIVQRVVRHLLVQGDVDRMRSGHAQHNVVAVWSRFGHQVRAHVAARTRLVVNDHRLPPLGAEFFSHHTGRDVGRATGRERHHDAHRLVGKVGGLRRQGSSQPGCSQHSGHGKGFLQHGVFSWGEFQNGKGWASNGACSNCAAQSAACAAGKLPSQ